MHRRFLPLFFLLALLFAAPVGAQDNAQPAGGAGQSTTDGNVPADETQSADQKSELDLPIDESVKVTVEPLVVSSLVDRVVEPCSVKVKCPGAASADVFIVPVDSPYGGFATGRPRSLGSDNKPEDGLSVRWTQKESDRYVKLFAVVHKKGSAEVVRSRTLDLAIGGARFEPKSSH